MPRATILQPVLSTECDDIAELLRLRDELLTRPWLPSDKPQMVSYDTVQSFLTRYCQQ